MLGKKLGDIKQVVNFVSMHTIKKADPKDPLKVCACVCARARAFVFLSAVRVGLCSLSCIPFAALGVHCHDLTNACRIDQVDWESETDCLTD